MNFEKEQFYQTKYNPSDRICSTSDTSESFLKGNAINHCRDKCPLKEPILSEQDDSKSYYSDLSLDFDENLDKEKEQFEKVSTTEDDSLLNTLELSDTLSLEAEVSIGLESN